MHSKISLKRIVGFLCIAALSITGFLAFSPGISVHANTLAKLGLETANHGNLSVTSDGIDNRTVGSKYIYYDVTNGNSVLIKAIPNDGYSFKQFKITDADGNDLTDTLSVVTTQQTIEFKMPDYKVLISADFVKGVKEEEETTLAQNSTTQAKETTKKEDTKKSLDFDTDNLNDYSDGSTVDPADIAILTSKGVSLMRADEQGVSTGAHLSVSIKADKTTGGTYNSETMKYEGVRTPGIYKYPEIVTYNIVVKNYGDTDLHYVKITDTISEELKNSVDVNSIKFNLQQGYYITTDSGEQVFVSVDGDGSENSSSAKSTESTESKTATAEAPSYSAGALTKSLTIDTLKAGKTVNLKLTMNARQDIKRALNLKNSVNVTASIIEVTQPDDSTESSTEEKGETTESTEKTTESSEESSETSTETTESTDEQIETQALENSASGSESSTSESENTESTTEKVEDSTSIPIDSISGSNDSEVKSKIVALPVDEAMHNDVEVISIGKYAVNYPQMSVSMVTDKTTSTTTNNDGVIGVNKVAGIYKAGDLAKFTITVKNEGNVALHDVTLSDAVSDALKGVLLTGTDGYYFDKTVTITDSQGKTSTAPITVTGQTTAVLSQLESGATAQFSFLAKIKSDAKEAKQLVNKVSLTAKWANMENGTTQYEAVESDLTKHVAEDAINVVGTPKMAVSIIANKTTGVTLNANGKYDGTRIAGKYSAGDSVEYKIRVANLGGTTLYNLKLTDTQSSDLQKAVKEDSAGFVSEGTATTTAGNEVKITSVSKDVVMLDKLNSGDSVTLTYKTTIKDNASMFIGVENGIKLEAQYDDLAQYPNTHLVSMSADFDSDKINVPGNPAGVISLKTDKDSYVPGDKVNYSITITNSGTCDLKNVLLKGTLDDKFTKFVSDNTFNQAKTLKSKNGKSVSITKKDSSLVQINSLSIGDSVTIPFTVTLKKDCGNQFGLSAKITMLPYYSTGVNTFASTDSSSVETSISVVGNGSASVAIKADKTTGKKLNEKTGRYEGSSKEGKYQTGDEIDYVVTVTNTGKSDLYNVRLEDVMADKLKEVVDEDAGFVIPETGEITSKNGKVITIGSAEISYNEGYKAKYTNDSILAQEENNNNSAQSTEKSNTTETRTEKSTEATTTGGALIVNAAETTTEEQDTITEESQDVTLTTDSDLLEKAFSGSETTTSLDGAENSENATSIDNTSTENSSKENASNSTENSSTGNNTGSSVTGSSDEPLSIQLTSSGSESNQVITLAQLPANDSVQLHFKAKLNSKAINATGLENTVKMTASKVSSKLALEALKVEKTMEDSDKISIESAASLRIAKLADKTKGVTLKDGRYEGVKSVAEYGPDSTVKYKLTITNLGSNTATNLLVTEEPSEQLKELSKWGKFSTVDSVKTKKGKTAKVTVDGVTAVVDKLASKDSIDLEFDVKLKKDANDALKINNVVSVSGNYVVNGQEVAMPTTDLMTDDDAISINKKVKPSGNEKSKKTDSKNSKGSGKNGKGSNNSSGSGKTSNGTKTGDSSPIGLLLAIMTVCAMTFVVILVLRRDKRGNQ